MTSLGVNYSKFEVFRISIKKGSNGKGEFLGYYYANTHKESKYLCGYEHKIDVDDLTASRL